MMAGGPGQSGPRNRRLQTKGERTAGQRLTAQTPTAKRKAALLKAGPSNSVANQQGLTPGVSKIIPLVTGAARVARNTISKGYAEGEQEFARRQHSTPPGTDVPPKPRANATGRSGAVTRRSSVKGPTPKQVKAIRQSRADDKTNLREYRYANEPPLGRKAQAAQDKSDKGRGTSPTVRAGRTKAKAGSRKPTSSKPRPLRSPLTKGQKASAARYTKAAKKK